VDLLSRLAASKILGGSESLLVCLMINEKIEVPNAVKTGSQHAEGVVHLDFKRPPFIFKGLSFTLSTSLATLGLELK
jgi:hypothetical protein